MRAFYTVIFLTAALFASAIARPGAKAQSHKRRARSLVFTGEPQNSQFNQNYDEFFKEQNDYPADRFRPQSEFSEDFNIPLRRNQNDHQVNTNNIDDYVDSDQDQDQDQGWDDDGDFDRNYQPSSKDSQADDLQKAMDFLRRQRYPENDDFDVDNIDDSPKGKTHDDQYDGDDDDEDDDEDDENYDDDDYDYDGDDDDDDDDVGDDDGRNRFVSKYGHASLQKILELLKKMYRPKGSDSDVEYTDFDNSHNDNGQKEKEDGIVKNGDDRPTGGFPGVPKFDDSRKGPFFGEDIDYGVETNQVNKDFDPPRDMGQDQNDEIDDSDEFADSDEFDSNGNWKGRGDVQGKLPNQNMDGGESSMDNIGMNTPQESDGRGVIEPRVREAQRYSEQDNFDFVPNVQRFRRSDFATQGSRRFHQCAEICSMAKSGAKNTPQIRSICGCEDYYVRDRK